MKFHPIFFLFFASAIFAGCGDSGPVEITEVREFDLRNDFELPKIAESDSERFRFSASRPNSRPETPGANPTPTPRQASGTLSWTTPEGWKELPATAMRQPNLQFGGSGEGECYVTRLSGSAGGLAANVNRWRKQIGADPLPESELENLPTKTLLGKSAVLVSLEGAYSGMGGNPKPGWRLHGLILIDGGSMVTVKMTGPAALVEENKAKFDAFCASLKQS